MMHWRIGERLKEGCGLKEKWNAISNGRVPVRRWACGTRPKKKPRRSKREGNAEVPRSQLKREDIGDVSKEGQVAIPGPKLEETGVDAVTGKRRRRRLATTKEESRCSEDMEVNTGQQSQGPNRVLRRRSWRGHR